ncbi:MAG: hypothetical protein WC929_02440 [Bacilli bacterium]|jgi:hypothetical protein
MDKTGFENYLSSATYMLNGKETHYTNAAIKSRVTKASALEKDLGINLDDYVTDDSKFAQLLIDVREAGIETLAHTPKSNAARHYYAYRNGGKQFGRLF